MFGKKKKKKSHGRHTHANYICALQTNLFFIIAIIFFFKSRQRCFECLGIKRVIV